MPSIRCYLLKSFINASLRLYNNKLIYSLKVNTDIVLESHLEGFCGIIDLFTNVNKENRRHNTLVDLLWSTRDMFNNSH
nr:MAG TPA: hypothetical protein [Caudoviricetes sp.]